jgi:antitoxin MazE
MKTTVRRVGNSKGVILPAALLSVCDIGDKVELSVENGRIIIAPVKSSREGWFERYRPEADEDAWGELGENDADSSGWEW